MPHGDSNPFCTRFIRPGAIPFRFPQDQNADDLVQRLRAGLRGAIVGPHGTGKSTLITTLMPTLRHAFGGRVLRQQCSSQGRIRLAELHRMIARAGDGLLVIDGFERLSRPQRILFRLALARSNCALLVTTHQPYAWLPVVWRTEIEDRLALGLTAELLVGQAEYYQRGMKVFQRLWAQRRPNLRETWFAMYDDYFAWSTVTHGQPIR